MKCLRTLLGVCLGDRMRNDLILQLTGQPPLEKILRRNRLRWFGHVNRMDNEEGHLMLPKKVLFSTFTNAKRPPHGVKLRWRDKIAKDLITNNIKNWRREVQNKKKWRKTINQEVKSTIVRSDAAQIIREYKEKAINHRINERAPSYNKIQIVNDDATFPQCRRTFKNERGVKIHNRNCKKRSTDLLNDVTTKTKTITKTTATHEITTLSSTSKNATIQKIKIIDLLIKNDNNESVCSNKSCHKLLKAQEATMHVKACAKSWLIEQGVRV